MSDHYDCDLFVIGAGSGGVAAARRAASYGARVVIAEKSRVGGTCVIRGCVPKKLLMYGGQFSDAFADSQGYGWSTGQPKFDWHRLRAAKDHEIDRLNALYLDMLARSGVELRKGTARFLDPHTVVVGDQTIRARTLLIASGGMPVIPNIPGADLCIISDDVFDLKNLPSSMVIIGSGYIAIEFASIFNSFGVSVTIVARSDEILRGFDDDIRRHISRELDRRGIALRLGCRPLAVEREGKGVRVLTDTGQAVLGDLVLAATGRQPNTSDLALEVLPLVCRDNGAIIVDHQARTSIPSLYAIGDVTDRWNLTPVAIAEGRALAERLYNANPVEVSYEHIPSAVFCTPAIGVVGLTEEEARQRYNDIDIYRTEFRPMRHTLSNRTEQVLIKLVVDRPTDRVLGCHIVAAEAPEIIQGVAIALNAGATKSQFDRTMALHPSTAEELVLLREPVAR